MSNSHEFMTMTGHTVVGWIWLELAMTSVALLKSGASGEREGFCRGQIQAAKWFFAFEVGRVERMGKVVGGRDSTVLDMKDEWM